MDVYLRFLIELLFVFTTICAFFLLSITSGDIIDFPNNFNNRLQ